MTRPCYVIIIYVFSLKSLVPTTQQPTLKTLTLRTVITVLGLQVLWLIHDWL